MMRIGLCGGMGSGKSTVAGAMTMEKTTAYADATACLP